MGLSLKRTSLNIFKKINPRRQSIYQNPFGLGIPMIDKVCIKSFACKYQMRSLNKP